MMWHGCLNAMEKKLLTILAILAVGGTCWLGGAVSTRTRWLNEDASEYATWHWGEHCRRWGAQSNNVFYGHYFNTNIAVGIGIGTNRHYIEFGFREDGVVVWRKR